MSTQNEILATRRRLLDMAARRGAPPPTREEWMRTKAGRERVLRKLAASSK